MMTEHQQFLAERDKIDFLIQKGFRINHIREHLDGADVEFVHPEENIKETLKIGTASGRKYFSSMLIKQNLKA
jgi:DNA-binding transcriptional MerR regulator